MRKAFDANIPKLKPRLRSAADGPAELPTLGDDGPEVAVALPSEGPVTATEIALPIDTATTTTTDTAAAIPSATLSEPVAEAGGDATAAPIPAAAPPGPALAALGAEASSAPPAAACAPDQATVVDVQARRERLEQVKRKVVAAMRPVPAMPELPETPARAGESALALVRDLEAQLVRAREIETALRDDLDTARTELAQAAADGRRGAERLRAVEVQVEEKRTVLEEMLGEMRALEEERDSAVARAQALAALDEERQTLLDGLSTRAEQAEKARAEGEAEIGRLGAEIEGRATDAARLRAALAQVTRERDDLARELSQAKRDRDELAEARKALEQVHEALASARAKLA